MGNPCMWYVYTGLDYPTNNKIAEDLVVVYMRIVCITYKR